MNAPLPPHLRAALGKGHAEPELWNIVTQLELYGVRVRVIRYQLGDLMADDLFRPTEIYRSKEATNNETGTLAGTHTLRGGSGT